MIRIYFRRPRVGIIKAGLYMRLITEKSYVHIRILPIADPHGYNEKRDDVIFQMPNWLRTLGFCRDPDFTIGTVDDPYLKRWWLLPRNKFFGMYLHQFIRSDDDRALHDHPWVNMSILLKGRYIEETPDYDDVTETFGPIARNRVERRAGDFVIRKPTQQHRVELIGEEKCWTMFITGPVVRLWGFHCPQGFVPWFNFVAKDPGAVGRGCDQDDGQHIDARGLPPERVRELLARK